MAGFRKRNWKQIAVAAITATGLAASSAIVAVPSPTPPPTTSSAPVYNREIQQENLNALASRVIAAKRAADKLAAEKAAAAAKAEAARKAAAAKAAAEKAAAEARAKAAAEARARAAAEAKARAEAEARARAAAAAAAARQAAWNYAHRWVKPIWRSYYVTSYWGYRNGRFHYGIDLAVPTGTPVHSATRGTVIYSGWDNSGFGYMVKVRNWDGTTTLYGHNSRLAVHYGQTVVPGQVVSYTGSTGNSSGPHLHVQVWPAHASSPYNAGSINPWSWYSRHGINL